MPILLAPALVSLGVEASIAGPLGSILFTGLSFLLSILFAPKVPKPEDGRNPFRQPIPNRVRIIGLRRNTGADMLYHSYQGSTFYGVKAVCDGEVSEFSRMWFHDDQVEFQGDGPFIDGLAADGPNRYGNEKCRVYFRYGVTPETSYADDVLDVFNRLLADSIWTVDHRGDGIASTLLVAADAGKEDQPSRFPFGIPQLSVEVDATKLFNPADVSQDGADPSTYTFARNDNPILQTVWFLTAPVNKGGMALNFAESFGTVLADISTQAAVCDEAIPLKGGGFEPRYRSGVMYKYSDDPSDVLAAILGSCDGFLAERGDGAFELKAGKWDSDDFAITIKDKHILSIHITRFRPDEDEVTGVIVKYNSVVHGHQTVDAPVWPRDAYQGGEDHRVRTIEVSYCPSGTQAQRISKRVAVYEMAPVRFTAVLNMYGILLLDRRGCTIQCSDDPAVNDAKVRLTRLELDLVAGTVEIDGTIFDPTVCDAWDAASEEGPLQPPIIVPVDDGNSQAFDVVAVASQIAKVVYVDVSFNPGDKSGDNEQITVRWRVDDTGGGVPGGWSQTVFSPGQIEKISDTQWIVTLNGLPEGILDIQVKAGVSDFTPSVIVDTENPAPGRPTGFSATLVGADVHLAWTDPNSANIDHDRVYRAIHGAVFGLAVDISGPITPVSRNSPNSYDDIAPASGSYDYWVSAENSANVSSLPNGPQNVVVP